ncbi:MAG: hypothetical protein AAFS10_04560 [Myxococcota bacterium]
MSWENLEQVVAPKVLLDAFETSDRLRALGVPHALVGGLAVGHHGYPRATKDVGFIVGTEAFATTSPLMTFREELADVVSWGIIDLLAALPDDPLLEAALQLPPPGAVPIVSIEVLVLMKLRAGRTQDLADIEHLVGAGMDVAGVLEWLRQQAAEHVPAFSRIAQQALA